jgi:Domain of unknown function (DUF397)
MTLEHPKGRFDMSRAVWRKAEIETEPESTQGCVEVAFVDDLIGVRSSADPDGPVLIFTEAEWKAFVEGAKDGEFDM